MCAAVLAFSVTACGENKDWETAASGTSSVENVSVDDLGIDYDSEEEQALTDEKVEAVVLSDIVKEWLGGYTMFIPGVNPEADYTYEDFVEKIGVGATTYNKYIYSNKYSETDRVLRQYTWIASDDEARKFAACFEERDGKWLLWGTGSVNL